MKYYLAVDIGASSGRHIVAYLENGKMVTEEIIVSKTALLSKKTNTAKRTGLGIPSVCFKKF
jgi:ribulose kinase